MPPRLAERVRVQQLNRLAYLCRIMPLAGINTLLFVAWACWGEDRPTLILLTSVGIASLYGLLMTRAWAWWRKAEPGQAAQRHFHGVNTLFVPLGVLWGILLIGLVPGGDAAQRSLLHGIAVGLVSSAALNVPLSAVLAFGLPVTIGAFGSVIATNNWDSLPTAACLLGYVTLTLAYALYSNRTFIDRVRNEARLEEQADTIGLLLRDFVENSSDWLWETDCQLRLKEVSDRMAQVADMPAEKLRGSSLPTLLNQVASDSGGEHLPTLLHHLSSRSSFRDLAIPVRIAGEARWWSLTGKACLDEQGTFAGFRGIGSDVTDARRATERISYLAHHDSLTGLPNRVAFTDALTRACARVGTESLALFCLDLDGFKGINDTVGHAVGDTLLIAVADRLRRCVREGDVAARLGGDEFAVIMANATAEDAAQTASRIVERLSQLYGLDGQSVEIGVSIGVAMAQSGSDVPSKLLQNADLALYRAKAEGRRTWRFFEAAMDEQAQSRHRLRAELRRALDCGEFRLMFQPVIGLPSRRVVAAEALLRWLHPTRGWVPPTEFVQLAEESGLIGPIGTWVIDQAIREAARWPSSVMVAVNLSPLQFRDGKLVGIVTDALRAHDFPPSRLELEVTESLLLKPTDQTLDTLRQFRALGVRIALDDFGTGYSALSYLRRFPFDTIKIDRSFVSDLGHDKAASVIIKAIVRIARSVGMSVTAEGVETEVQEAALRACGCERVQGFLFSRPRSADDVGRFIAADLDMASTADAA